MTTEYLFSNNATTTLAQSVSATATVLNVTSGTGALFPSPSSGQAFAVTLVDAATGLTNEICYCTSRSGDQLTVVRGREGTNAIAWSAGDTCANYITADVMESWLQESDLNGYATQAWSSSQFVGRGASVYDFTPLQLGVNKASGQVWTSYTDASGNIKYAFSQPAGDYATNPALQAETQRATQVEDNLQTGKVNRAGDTMRGALSTFNDPNLTNGAWNYSPAFRSYTNTRAGFRLFAQDRVGDAGAVSGVLTLDWNGTDRQFWWYNQDGSITQSTKGNVAWQTDISNLQNQINGKQAAGNYVTGTSAGKKIVTFTASVSGTQDIPFSGLSRVDVVLGSCSTQPGSNNQRGGIIQINSWTSNSVNVTGKFTSTNISDSTDLPCYFVAIGDA